MTLFWSVISRMIVFKVAFQTLGKLRKRPSIILLYFVHLKNNTGDVITNLCAIRLIRKAFCFSWWFWFHYGSWVRLGQRNFDHGHWDHPHVSLRLLLLWWKVRSKIDKKRDPPWIKPHLQLRMKANENYTRTTFTCKAAAPKCIR